MEELTLSLSDGTEVALQETWDCADDCTDSHSSIVVIDRETEEILCEYNGNLPDFEDEDFDLDALVSKIEEEIFYNQL